MMPVMQSSWEDWLHSYRADMRNWVDLFYIVAWEVLQAVLFEEGLC